MNVRGLGGEVETVDEGLGTSHEADAETRRENLGEGVKAEHSGGKGRQGMGKKEGSRGEEMMIMEGSKGK